MKKIMLISGIVIVAFIGVVYFTISTSPSPTQETLPPIQEMRILAEDIQENNLYIAKFGSHYTFIVKNTKDEHFPKRPHAFIERTNPGRTIVGAGSGLAGFQALKNTEFSFMEQHYVDIVQDGDILYLVFIGDTSSLIKKYTISTHQLEDVLHTELLLSSIYDIQGEYLLTHSVDCYKCDSFGPYDVVLINTKTRKITNLKKVVDVNISEEGTTASYTRLYLNKPNTGCSIGLNPQIVSVGEQRENQALSAF